VNTEVKVVPLNTIKALRDSRVIAFLTSASDAGSG
jgi:hypothetical protein